MILKRTKRFVSLLLVLAMVLPMIPFSAFAADEEYEEVVEFALELGIGHGFLQEGEAAAESFIPEF